jgi:hypothetical protein
VEFLKQVEILSKQPYFQPNFSEQNNPSSNESPPLPTLLPYFFNEVIRLVCVVSFATEVFLVNRLVRKIRLKIRFVETITIPF